MYKYGANILRFEGIKDYIDLKESLEWDERYLEPAKRVLVVPDFYFLFLYGRESCYDVYYPYLRYIFDSPVHEFVLMSEVFEEMYGYFDRGKRAAEKVLNSSAEVYKAVQKDPIISDVVAAWYEYKNSEKEKSVVKVHKLLAAYRALINSRSETVAQFKIINDFDSDYLNPLENIYKLIAKADKFKTAATSDLVLDSDTFDRATYDKAKLRLIQKRKNNTNSNEIDARVIAKCKYINSEFRDQDIVLLNFTDGVAYDAAMYAASTSQDRVAKNLRCTALQVASQDDCISVRLKAEEIKKMLLFGDGGGDSGLDQYPHFQKSHTMFVAGKKLTRIMEEICDISRIKHGYVMEYSTLSGIGSSYKDYDDPRYNPIASRLDEISKVVGNVVKFASMPEIVSEFDEYFKNLWRDFVWLQDKESWGAVKEELQKKVEAYDITRNTGPVAADIRTQEFIVICRTTMMNGKFLSKESAVELANECIRELDSTGVQLIRAALKTSKNVSVEEEKFIDAENIKIFLQELAKVRNRHES